MRMTSRERTTRAFQTATDMSTGFAGRTPAAAALVTLLALGCAGAPPPRLDRPAPPPPPPKAEPAPAPEPVKLVWLPLDPMVHAKLGVALNGRFEHVQFPGIDAQAKAPVSMDVAQMSLECGQPTVECFVAVGKHLQANRLLWADVKRDKRKKITVALSLLDVGRATIVNRTERTFANQKAALAGIDGLMTALTTPAASASSAAAGETKP
jgi:hypothetical protein